jgi:hypothetical protein
MTPTYVKADGRSPSPLVPSATVLRMHKLAMRFWRPSLNLALTNSTNRTVINSAIASTSQLVRGSVVLPSRGARTFPWGFCPLHYLMATECSRRRPTTFDHALAIEATAGELTTWVDGDRHDDCRRCLPLLCHRGAVVAGRILHDQTFAVLGHHDDGNIKPTRFEFRQS